MGHALRRRLRMLSPVAADGLAELRAAWRSHALTLIGLVWGAAAVVLLLSFGVGFTQFLDLGVRKTGDRWTAVQSEYTSAEMGGRRPGRRIQLTVDDLDRIRAGVPSALRAAGEILEAASVETAHRTRATIVSAGSPETRGIRNHRILRGRYYDASDERSARRVAAIGSELEQVLFADGNGLGRSLQIDGVPFQVVGVLAPKGSQLMTNMDLHDRMVFVPLAAGRRLFRDRKEIDHIYVEPRRIEEGGRMEGEIRAALWPLHHLHPEESEAIRFESVPEIMRPVRKVFVALHVLLGVVGTVTLAMSGVSVANLMIAIVGARRRELAMRRACGARRSDLLAQLMVETLVIVILGGAVGVAGALAITTLLGHVPLPPELPTPQVSASVLLTTFAVLTAVGLVAGIAPARIAARADPSTALRVT
jgi:putative ABC transport system permease protein